MKRLKIKDKFYKIIDGFEVNESSREVKYSNVKVDFTSKGIQDLPLKYQECQLVEGEFRHVDADEGKRVEGTNLQVNQGNEKLSELEYIKGQTTQTGTPTPTSPQSVNVVTGRQVVSVCGKNLCNLENLGLIVNSTGGVQTNSRYWNCVIDTTNNNSLYVSGDYTTLSDDVIRVGGFNEYPTLNSQGTRLTPRTNTAIDTTNYNYVLFCFGAKDGHTIDEVINSFMITYGNQYVPYEEYKGQDYEINLGKNLFNKNGSIISGGRLDNVGAIYYQTGYYTSEFIKVSPSTIYSKNSPTQDAYHRVCFYTSANVPSFISGANTNVNTFTTPSNAQYLRFCGLETEIDTAQLEKGSSSSYSPYKTPIELCKIGDYQDYIYKENGKWYIHKEINKVILNGTENWARATTATTRSSFSTQMFTDRLTTSTTSEFYSSNFYYRGNAQGTNLGYAMSFGQDPYSRFLYVQVPTDVVAPGEINDFKTWLSTHNTDVYYILNTPTNTLIEDEELINQLNAIQLISGLNNIIVSSPYLPGIIGIHYDYQVEHDIERIDDIIYTGYVNNYTLPKMKNKLEYRELDIDLLSPLALATLRTADAVGTYNLQPLIREILQPLIDDGFTLKELNVGNNQISVNYLTETIESALNKLSNKFNFWWYIDKNKNIYINDINYVFSKNKVLTYDDNNKIKGLIDFTPSMESIDYCNTIDFTNVRLFTFSYYRYYYYQTTSGNTYSGYTSYNPMIEKQTLSPGDEITFDIPFVINTSKSGRTDTTFETSDYYFRLEKKDGDNYSIVVELLPDANNKVIIPNNATISDSFNDSKEFVFVRDVFFKNLIVGMKYNGNSTIQVSYISSTTALMLAKLRITDDEEIEKNKEIISTTGIVEKQIDANELWLTYNEVLEISKSLIGNNNVNVEKVNILTDNENNLKVGDMITINKPTFLTNGDFVITDKKRKYYDNVNQWEFVLNNTNILESYIDLFRSTEEQENEEAKYSLITSNYIKEGIREKYEVDIL